MDAAQSRSGAVLNGPYASVRSSADDDGAPGATPTPTHPARPGPFCRKMLRPGEASASCGSPRKREARASPVDFGDEFDRNACCPGRGTGGAGCLAITCEVTLHEGAVRLACRPVAGTGQSRAQPVARASAGRQATPPAPGPTRRGAERQRPAELRCPSTPRSPAPRQSFAWRRDEGSLAGVLEAGISFRRCFGALRVHPGTRRRAMLSPEASESSPKSWPRPGYRPPACAAPPAGSPDQVRG
jgi:hypothetical protein